MLLLQTLLAPMRDCFPAQLSFIVLLLLILMDWVFGIGNALLKHEFSSEKMRQGIGHKCTEFGFVFVGILVDALVSVGFNLGFNGPVLTTVIIYLCLMEIGSLMETFAKINPKLAKSPVFRLMTTVHIISENNMVIDLAEEVKDEDNR